MANVSAYRFVGPTTAISVTTSSSTSVTITPNGNDQANFCGFLNVGTTPIAITTVSYTHLTLPTIYSV